MPNNLLTIEQTCPRMVGKAWEDLEFLHGYMSAKRHVSNFYGKPMVGKVELDAIKTLVN